MTIDKRINFQGGGMDMGNASNQKQSASKANTTSKSTSSGTGGSSGNLGGGGGGQDTDYRRYSPPVAPTYNSTNIDQKPVTGDDYRRSQNEFINNFNQNEASRFEPTFFNRNYNPITLDQFGSSNQPFNFGDIDKKQVMGGILGLINPFIGLAYRGADFLQNTASPTLKKFRESPTLVDFYNKMKTAPVNDTIDIREKFNRTEGLSDVRPTSQIFEFDPTNFNTRNRTAVNSFDEINNQNEYTSGTIPFDPAMTVGYGTGIESVNPEVPKYYASTSDLAPEFQSMATFAGNYSQNAVSNQLYGEDYDVLDPFTQQQIDSLIEQVGTKSTGELAGNDT